MLPELVWTSTRLPPPRTVPFRLPRPTVPVTATGWSTLILPEAVRTRRSNAAYGTILKVTLPEDVPIFQLSAGFPLASILPLPVPAFKYPVTPSIEMLPEPVLASTLRCDPKSDSFCFTVIRPEPVLALTDPEILSALMEPLPVRSWVRPSTESTSILPEPVEASTSPAIFS